MFNLNNKILFSDKTLISGQNPKSLYDNEENWLGGQIEVTFGGDYSNSKAFQLKPQRYIPHSDYDSDSISNDIALLQFAEDILAEAEERNVSDNVRKDLTK